MQYTLNVIDAGILGNIELPNSIAVGDIVRTAFQFYQVLGIRREVNILERGFEDLASLILREIPAISVSVFANRNFINSGESGYITVEFHSIDIQTMTQSNIFWNHYTWKTGTVLHLNARNGMMSGPNKIMRTIWNIELVPFGRSHIRAQLLGVQLDLEAAYEGEIQREISQNDTLALTPASSRPPSGMSRVPSASSMFSRTPDARTPPVVPPRRSHSAVPASPSPDSLMDAFLY